MLRGQDVLVLLWLAYVPEQPPSLRALAADTRLSLASVQRALQRLQRVGLYDARRRRIVEPRAEEFLVHAARYIVPPERGGETRGFPTAWAAPPLVGELASTSELAPVWPDPDGTVRGLQFEPLHPVVPGLAREHEGLYELLALVDALRSPTDVRTTSLARDLLAGRLRNAPTS